MDRLLIRVQLVGIIKQLAKVLRRVRAKTLVIYQVSNELYRAKLRILSNVIPLYLQR